MSKIFIQTDNEQIKELVTKIRESNGNISEVIVKLILEALK